MNTYGYVMGAATELLVTIGVCLYLGNWTDGKFQTGGAATIAGVFLGAVFGFYRFFYRLKKLNEKK